MGPAGAPSRAGRSAVTRKRGRERARQSAPVPDVSGCAARTASADAALVRGSGLARLYDLSDDTLRHVLSYCVGNLLDIVAVSQVSRRLRRVARDPTLWSHVVVPHLPSRREAEDADGASSDSDASDSDESYSVGSTPRPRRARELGAPPSRLVKRRRRGHGLHNPRPPPRLRESSAASAIYEVVSIAGDRLVSLDVSELAPNQCRPRELGKRELSVLAQRCSSSLTSFSCSYIRRLSTEEMTDFVGAFNKLRSLTLINASLNLRTVGSMLRACPTIARIALVDCFQVRGSACTFLEAFRPILPSVEAIDVSGTHLSGLPLRQMGSLSQKLEYLAADRCTVLLLGRSFPVEEGQLWFPSLATLRLENSSVTCGDFVLAVMSRCSKLRTLSVSSNLLPYLLHGSPLFANPFTICNQIALEHLSLFGQDLDDSSFNSFVIPFRRTLKTLDVSRNLDLTGSSIRRDDTFPCLESLNLSWTGFYEESVFTIWFIARRLRRLRLEACRSIDNRVLKRDPIAYLMLHGRSSP